MSTTKVDCPHCDGQYTQKGVKIHISRKHPADTLTGLPTPKVEAPVPEAAKPPVPQRNWFQRTWHNMRAWFLRNKFW